MRIEVGVGVSVAMPVATAVGVELAARVAVAGAKPVTCAVAPTVASEALGVALLGAGEGFRAGVDVTRASDWAAGRTLAEEASIRSGAEGVGSMPATDTNIDAAGATERSAKLSSWIPPLSRMTTMRDSTRPSSMTDSALTN